MEKYIINIIITLVLTRILLRFWREFPNFTSLLKALKYAPAEKFSPAAG